MTALTTLYQATCNKIAKLKEANEESSRVQEWEDVLIENVHANLTKLWLFAAGKSYLTINQLSRLNGNLKLN